MPSEPNIDTYSGFLQKEDTLILLIDLQESMLDICEDSLVVAKNAEALLEAATILDVPVIFSEHNPEKLGGFMDQFLDKVTDPVVVRKMEFSCLNNSDCRLAVERTGRKTLILTGVETHICVFQTAARAIRQGYTVHVVSDAVSSRSRSNHEIGLRRMERAGAVVTSTEMAIFELLGKAGTPEFRQALPVIKTLG